MDIDGNYLYVANHFLGLQIFNIADKTNPTLLGNYNTGGIPKKVTIYGDYAYVPKGDTDPKGLDIVDVSLANNPEHVTTYSAGTWCGDIAIVDNVGYSSVGGKLEVLSLASPSAPFKLGDVPVGSFADSIKIIGHYAYMATVNTGIVVVNVENVYEPVVMRSFATSYHTKNLSVVGNYAYVADGRGGLVVIKVKEDFDNDDILDDVDPDDDNDGVLDVYDAFPMNASETTDTDHDGTGNNADTDDDNDGILDIVEIAHGLNPLNASDAQADFDNDGFTNAIEITVGSNIRSASSKPGWTPILMDNITTFVPYLP